MPASVSSASVLSAAVYPIFTFSIAGASTVFGVKLNSNSVSGVVTPFSTLFSIFVIFKSFQIFSFV